MISASLNRCKGMEDQVGDFLKQLAAKLELVLLILGWRRMLQIISAKRSSFRMISINIFLCSDTTVELWSMGGQIVFAWDRPENFLITRNHKYKMSWNATFFISIYFLKYLLKNVLFRYLVNSMQNLARSTNWHSAIGLLATPVMKHVMCGYLSAKTCAVYQSTNVMAYTVMARLLEPTICSITWITHWRCKQCQSCGVTQ